MPTITYSPRVVPYFPRGPQPRLLLIGEAPGPRGADRTGFPFWGDDSGLDLYGLIESFGLMTEPFVRWKRRADISGTQPPAGSYAITNACPQMPLAAEGGFAAPDVPRLELESERIAQELRTLKPSAVLACGRAAAFTLARASERLEVHPPLPLAGSFPSLKLTAAMAELGNPKHAWVINGAHAFVTCHPSRGQWSPLTSTGKLHLEIVARVREQLG